MAMLIGDKSLQFEFVNSMTNPSPVVHNVTYNQATKVLSVPAGIIQHYTLGIDTISSSHAADEYKFWSLPAFTTPTLTDGTKKYYLYAKVSKTAKDRHVLHQRTGYRNGGRGRILSLAHGRTEQRV